MDTNEQPPQQQAGTGYPTGQLASAFHTARTHEDEPTRARAHQRVQRWLSVLTGMAKGNLTIGSRTPVATLPAWVTPEVIRGGFATGTAAAAGPLRPHEIALAKQAGIPLPSSPTTTPPAPAAVTPPSAAIPSAAPSGPASAATPTAPVAVTPAEVSAVRRALFGWLLTDAGQAELCRLLDTGAYRVALPEQAALLTVAWLVRAGDRDRALAVLDEIGPHADRLCLTPEPDPHPRPAPDVVWRATAAETAQALSRRTPNARVEANREALTVWNPFADELLTLWLAPDASAPGPDWLEQARTLLARYQQLAAAHTRCTKHRRPKENLAILLHATEQAVADRELTPRARGLLGHAVTAMVARRGRPGSPEHTTLRATQSREAAVPAHHVLARVVVARMADLDPQIGITDPEPLCAPTPDGTPVPESIKRVVRRATAGRVPELVEARLVPSAEVLAELVPQIAAAVSAAAYPDPSLQTLVAATYRAFRNRRSLLLLNLEHQIRITELPWTQALQPHRRQNDDTRREARDTLRRLGELALDGFPATLLPSTLVRELSALATEAGQELPWVEELAADIFMGSFSPKFVLAANLAGELLSGTLYARYYDIDYTALSDRQAFDRLCHERAGVGRHEWSVAAHGRVIEQAQILTTHNLATLVHAVGVEPAGGWQACASRAFDHALRLAGRIENNPRPLAMIKDMAYAWRQAVFFLSVPGVGAPEPVFAELKAKLAAAPPAVQTRLSPVVAGLTGEAPAEPLLGWQTR